MWLQRLVDFFVSVRNLRVDDRELMAEATTTLILQQESLHEAARQINQWQQLALTAQRSARDLAVAFRIAQETPEIDLRDDLDQLVTELSDVVARLEEHLV